MAGETLKPQIFQPLAKLLEYPQGDLMPLVRACESSVSPKDEEIQSLLGQFRVFVEASSLAQIQEVYTGTFDLDATYHPYAGYHLLGETYKRSVFLLELKTRFRTQGFEVPGTELPDHLSVMLRFLAVCEDAEVTREIASEALLPALEKMLKQKEDKQAGPYIHLLSALQIILGQRYPIEKEVESRV